MKVGTKSVLFGAHCFFIHPIFVAIAWCKLYGFTWDPRIWISFFVHDLGYIGKPNMDGPEGELHVEFGARLMGWMFGHKWYEFCLYHSRFYARKHNHKISKLCVADKLSMAIEPEWLYLSRVILSGEVKEYVEKYQDGRYTNKRSSHVSITEWYSVTVKYMIGWVSQNVENTF